MTRTVRRRVGGVLVAGAAAIACGVVHLAAQFPGPGGFPGMEERKVVSQFDADRNGRLNSAERAAARTWLAGQSGNAAFGAAGARRGGGPPPGFPPGFGGPGRAAPSPGPRMTPADVPPAGTESLYDTNVLRTIFLQFETDEWESELSAFYNTDVDVPAAVTVDGRTYREVGVHFRGMSSYMMTPAGSKRSLNLAFDFADERQRLLGHRTVNLLNVNGDPTFVRPVLYAEIAGRHIPVPRANYVRVVINGEYWGVYVNAEQFNGDFVASRFGSAQGTRWKVPGAPFGQGGLAYIGENADAYRRIYEIKSKDTPQAWEHLIRLTRVLNQTPPAQLEAALEPILDVDGVLRFLAVEVALVNSDGYWARASDYSLFEDSKGRFHVIPHDINEGLVDERGGPGGRGGRGGRGPRGSGVPPGPDGPPPGFEPPPGFPPMPPGGFAAMAAMFSQGGPELDPLIGLDDANKPLRSKLLAVPALRARYLRYVRDIAERDLAWASVEPLARRYRTLIGTAVESDTRKLYTSEAFRSGLSEGDDSLQAFVARRREYLLKAVPVP